MTSLGPASLRRVTLPPGSRALGYTVKTVYTSVGAGTTPRCSSPHRANGQLPQASGLPKAVVQRGATASGLFETSCPGQPANVPGLASKEQLWETCKRRVDVSCWLGTKTNIAIFLPEDCSSNQPFCFLSLCIHSFFHPFFSRSDQGYMPHPRHVLSK